MINPLTGHDGRDAILKFRVTDKERAEFKKLAADRGLSESALIRRLIAAELGVVKLLKGFDGHPPVIDGHLERVRGKCDEES